MGISLFTPAPLPANERRRSEAAIASGLLRRIDDPYLSQIASTACRALDADWCGVTILIGETQHVVASSGGLIGMFRRSTSLCSYVVNSPDHVFFILDAPNDQRFSGNPFVDDGMVHFFAGAVIRDHAEYAIGALCITDKAPRKTFSEEQAELLCESARTVTASITLT